MALQNPGIPAAARGTTLSPGSRAPVKEVAVQGRFSQIMAQMAPNNGPTVRVQRGDTLIGLVKSQLKQQGLPVSNHQALRLSQQVAADNRIANPNRIHAGQRLDVSRLHGLGAPAPAAALGSPQALAQAKAALEPLRSPSLASTSAAEPLNSQAWDHPVLERVLDRAVSKGFIPSADLAKVRDKILQVSEKHKFAPDDFARLSLRESGGMNPQASNGRCHGVIQFCDGPARGAAAVGFPSNAKAILGMSLFKQLDLVDRFFDKVGLPPHAQKLGLDDLYLSVLSPAARSEARPNAPLPIAGPQASLLHVGRNPRNPITRASLVAGLRALTETILSADTSRKGPARIYAEVANPSEPSTEW